MTARITTKNVIITVHVDEIVNDDADTCCECDFYSYADAELFMLAWRAALPGNCGGEGFYHAFAYVYEAVEDGGDDYRLVGNGWVDPEQNVVDWKALNNS